MMSVAISNEKPVPSLRIAPADMRAMCESCNLKREACSLATTNAIDLFQVVLTVAISNEKPVPSLHASATPDNNCPKKLQSQTRSLFPRYPYAFVLPFLAFQSCNLKREACSLATAPCIELPCMFVLVAISNEKPVPSLPCHSL